MSDRLVVDTQMLTLQLGDWCVPCTIGRSGACAAEVKREGDGCTPLGVWPLRAVLFRQGRSAPPAGIQLPWRWVHGHDGWSDDPADPAYNRPVRLPHGFGAETLQRDDMLYDIIVILGHNDDPPEPGKGSAIFFHLWDEARASDARMTEGCVAIKRADMMDLLPRLSVRTVMDIRGG
jgi:L,D-peptidoglycan transpeptidase YkuD (ErfK/YbiS/YcfS/YnhG family)